MTLELIITTCTLGGAIGGFLIGASRTGNFKAANDEINRQAGHIEILQDLCAEIHAYTAPQKSGTAQRVARMAKAGCAK